MIFAGIQAKLLALALAAVVGGGVGVVVTQRHMNKKVVDLTADLRDARRASIAERAARDEIAQQCAAGAAAAVTAEELRATALRAIERATRELDNAQGDDADPLRAQFERMRGQGATGAGTGGDPGNATGAPDAVPQR